MHCLGARQSVHNYGLKDQAATSVRAFQKNKATDMEKEQTGINFNAPVTVGTFVKVEAGATYIKNNFPSVTSFHDGEESDSLVDDGIDVDAALVSVFMGDRDAAERYLRVIKDATDVQVIEHTKKLVEQNIISPISKNKTLYVILSSKGLYKSTLSNWNKMIR